MLQLLLLFILVPIAELALLIELGSRVGLPATLALIVATGALGAYLARRQGLAVLRQIRSETSAGRLPARQLVDGALILVAAAVLMTPGILTDAFGFLCLFPPARRRLREWLAHRFERSLRRGTVAVAIDLEPGADFGAGGHGPYRRETRDVTPRAAASDRSRDRLEP